MSDADLLRRATQRAGDRRFFLASALLAYAGAEGLDEAALAARLGCDPADLPALLLCRRPAGEAAAFRADVERIAEQFHLDPARLAETVRLADALEALGSLGEERNVDFLAAARDRERGAGERGDAEMRGRGEDPGCPRGDRDQGPGVEADT